MIGSRKLARYRSRILASVANDGCGCWIWQKRTQKNGYGVFAVGGGKTALAHRVSYLAFVGEMPEGMKVCHRCDVRGCVNPNHLFLGTQSDNIRDAYTKNRMRLNPAKGELSPVAKLTDIAVREIVGRLRAMEPKASIARAFSVSDRTILLISRGETWKHITRAA